MHNAECKWFDIAEKSAMKNACINNVMLSPTLFPNELPNSENVQFVP